jgi:hypothetical protein
MPPFAKPFVAPFVFFEAQIRQAYQQDAEDAGQFNCSGTVGWARATDLLFHRQCKGPDRATLFPPLIRKWQYYQLLTSSYPALSALQLALWW